MLKKDMLYEGKAKKVFLTDDPKRLIVDYKDDATAFNGLKKGTITGKGVVNNRLSNYFFRLLEEQGVPTHYIEELDARTTVVKKVEIVPLEVIIRNIAAGSMCKRLGMTEGKVFAEPLLEYSYKNDALNDPLVNEAHALALEVVTREELAQISHLAYQVNAILRPLLLKHDIILVDFKLEFGRYEGSIILADEISPDTCRFWDAKTMKKLDKDRFRQDLDDVDSGYLEVQARLLGGTDE